MAYQPFWVIQCQSHPCRRTKGMLFNLQLRGGSIRFLTFPMQLIRKWTELGVWSYFKAAVQLFINCATDTLPKQFSNNHSYWTGLCAKKILRNKMLSWLWSAVYDLGRGQTWVLTVRTGRCLNFCVSSVCSYFLKHVRVCENMHVYKPAVSLRQNVSESYISSNHTLLYCWYIFCC